MHPDTPEHEPDSLSSFLSTAPAVDALNRLERGLGVRRPFLIVTGQPGTGKSTLAREAVRRWSERVTPATLDTAGLDAGSIDIALLTSFGGSLKRGTHALAVPERLIETLANATAGGRVAVLIVDEADGLPDDALLELLRIAIRAEQRQCPLEVILVGSLALAQRLETAALAELRDLVSVRVTLEPLSQHDTRHYLLQRPTGSGAVMFSRKACRDIHAASRGRIRDIEAIAAESARRAARANATTVSPEHVRAAAQAVRSRKPGEPVNAAPGAAPARPAPEPSTPAVRAVPAPAAGRSRKANAAANAAAAAARQAPAPSAPAARAVPPPAEEPAAVEMPSNGTAETREPEPVAQGSHVDEEVSASAAATTTNDTGDAQEFRPSDDPRVKDWLARFGGAGVRIGANYAPSSSGRDLDFTDDGPADVRPLGAAPAAAPDSPPPVEAAPRAPAAATPPARAPWHAEAGAAEPVVWPPPQAPRRGSGLGRRRDSSLLWQAATLVLGIALGAVLFGQRGLEPRESRTATADLIAPAESTFLDPAPKPKSSRGKRNSKRGGARQATSQVNEVVSVRYTVVVATFLDADMARAERDHLARLMPYRVWVSSSTVSGVKSFRIQFGAFASRDEAEAAAQKLLRQGLLRDASVIELPRAD